MMKLHLLGAVCLSMVAFVSLSAKAAVITPISVDASSTFSTYNKDNLINNSGLSGSLHDEDFRNMWINNSEGASGILTFNLGGIFSISSSDIWQYNANFDVTNRGLKTFDIYSSIDGVSFSFITDTLLTESPGGSISAQNIEFNSTARFIRFDITSNYGSPFYTGLSEVKFSGEIFAVPIPPAIWLFGTGLLGLVGIARGKKAA